MLVVLGAFCPQNLFAVLVIDFDTFHFPKVQQRGVRVVRFDTTTQKYQGLDYFVQTIPTLLHFQFLGIDFDSNCNVTVPTTFPLEGTIIRTKGTVEFDDLDKETPDEWVTTSTRDFTDKGKKSKYRVLSHGDIEIKQGSFIMKTLNKFSKKTKGGADFLATFHQSTTKETKLMSHLSADKTDNKNERGHLGELLVKLNMLSFGYRSYFSKYGTDNGFDGVFKDESVDPQSFITESKCEKREDGVKVIMRDNLSESKMCSKLQAIFNKPHTGLSGEAIERLKATGNLVKKDIETSPSKVFKFAHRVKADGSCQCLVKEFNIEAYQLHLLKDLSPQSPVQVKELAVNNLMKQMNASPEERVSLLLELTPGSSMDKLQLIFQALEIDGEKQGAIFEILEPKAKKKLPFDDGEVDELG